MTIILLLAAILFALIPLGIYKQITEKRAELDDVQQSVNALKVEEKNCRKTIGELNEEICDAQSRADSIEQAISEQKAEYSKAIEAVDNEKAKISRLKAENKRLTLYNNTAFAIANGAEEYPAREVPFLAEPIDSLNIKERLKTRLKTRGINDVKDLVAYTPKALRAVPLIGPFSVKDIEKALEVHQCYLGMDYVKIEGHYYTHK